MNFELKSGSIFRANGSVEMKVLFDSICKLKSDEPIVLNCCGKESRSFTHTLVEMSVDDLYHSVADGAQVQRFLCEFWSLLMKLLEHPAPVVVLADGALLDEQAVLSMFCDKVIVNDVVSVGMSCRLTKDLFELFLSSTQFAVKFKKVRYQDVYWSLDIREKLVFWNTDSFTFQQEDAFWQIVSEELFSKLFAIRKKERSRLQSEHKVKGFDFLQFQPRFYSRLSRKFQLASHISNRQLDVSLVENQFPQFVLEIEDLIPPVGFLEKLVKYPYTLYVNLTGQESLKKDQMAVLHSRLEAVLGRDEAKAFRKSRLCYMQSKVFSDDLTNHLNIKFVRKYQLLVSFSSQRWEFKKLAENRVNRSFGWYELSRNLFTDSADERSSELFQSVRSWLSSLGIGVLSTVNNPVLPWMVSDWIALSMLKAMFEACEMFQCTMDVVLGCLGEKGHTRIGQDEFWESLTQECGGMLEDVACTQLLQFEGPALRLPESLLEPIHWRGLKRTYKKDRSFSSKKLSAADALNLEFLVWTFARQIARELVTFKIVETQDDAELLVSESLGFSRKLCRMEHIEVFYGNHRSRKMLDRCIGV